MYLGLLAIAIVPALQAAWNADGTDVKEEQKLVFVTKQDDLPSLKPGQANNLSLEVNRPLTPKSTKEWKVKGLSYYIIGGIKVVDRAVVRPPYPATKGAKTVDGKAVYTASPTKENEYSTADAYPVSTTDDTRTLERL